MSNFSFFPLGKLKGIYIKYEEFYIENDLVYFFFVNVTQCASDINHWNFHA